MMLADAILTNYPRMRIGCPIQAAENFYLPVEFKAKCPACDGSKIDPEADMEIVKTDWEFRLAPTPCSICCAEPPHWSPGWKHLHISRADALHRLNINAQIASAALQFQPLKRISIERPDGTKQHMFVPEFL